MEDIYAIGNSTLIRLKKGDHQAFFEIYEAYHKSLYHFVKGYLKDENASEDVVHDVFLKLWEVKDRIKPELPIINYLYRIARNAVFKELKNGLNALSVKRQLSSLGYQVETSVETIYQAHENEILFNNAVDGLPLQRRRVFKLCRLNEKTYREAANELGISPHTVKEHMSLAMKSINLYVGKNS